MERKGVIKYPYYLVEFSRIVGTKRQELNEGITKGNPTFDRGDDKNTKFHIHGALGELVFSNYLHELKIPHVLAPLIDPKPVATYDIKIQGSLLDVKTLNKGSLYFYVNKRSHDKLEKEITHYVFLYPKGVNTFIYKIVDKIAVNNWETYAFNEKNVVYRKKIDANL